MSVPERATTSPRPRSVAIDMLRGCSILWVLLIHAEALPGNPLMVYVFNHAAQYFIVLLGLNAELWWSRARPHPLRTWYVDRTRRLLVPLWAALPVWWLLVIVLKPRLQAPLTVSLLLQHLIGLTTQIGTGWFVTLAIEMAVLFPLLHFLARRIGYWPLLALGIACSVLSLGAQWYVIHRAGLRGWLIFPPRWIAHMALGMVLARNLGRLGPAVGVAAAVLVAVCIATTPNANAAWDPYGGRLIELPMTVLLLVLMTPLSRVPGVAPPLVWLGVRSYAIYLGQMLTHCALVFAFGMRVMHRTGWEWYALALLAGALVWVGLGEVAGGIGRRLDDAGVRLPGLARPPVTDRG